MFFTKMFKILVVCCLTMIFSTNLIAASFSKDFHTKKLSTLQQNQSIHNNDWLADFAISNDGSTFYALDVPRPRLGDEPVLYIANSKSGQIINKVSLYLGASDAIALMPDNSKAYVGATGLINSIDLRTGSLRFIKINWKDSIRPLKLTKDGRTLYAAENNKLSSGDAGVYIIDTQFDVIKTYINQSFSKHGGFYGMELNEKTSKLYLLPLYFDPLFVLDTQKFLLDKSVLPKLIDNLVICLDKDRNRLYLSSGQSILSVDATTYKIMAEIFVEKEPLQGVLADGNKKLYLSNVSSNTVTIIDIDSQKTIKTIPVGREPLALRVSKDGKKVYVGNARDFSISVIDTEKDKVIETILMQINK